MTVSLRRDLASQLLDLEDHEFGRLERREADDDVDDAEVDVVLRRGRLVAVDEVGLLRRLALEGALPEKVVHESADVQPDLRPQRLVVRLEDDPLGAAVEALFEVEGEATHGNVFPFRGETVRALSSARSPDHPARGRHGAEAIDAP